MHLASSLLIEHVKSRLNNISDVKAQVNIIILNVKCNCAHIMSRLTIHCILFTPSPNNYIMGVCSTDEIVAH